MWEGQVYLYLGEKSLHTLIFNGSPRKNGDTAGLINALSAQLPGVVQVVQAYGTEISPCVDCRFCWEHEGCAIPDGWTEIDGLIRESDNIVIASPIYFSQLTGPLLSLMSRLQQYFCARAFQHREPLSKAKKGGILLAGGGDGHMSAASESAECLLRHMNCREIFPAVCAHNTNQIPAVEAPGVTESLQALARFLAEKKS